MTQDRVPVIDIAPFLNGDDPKTDQELFDRLNKFGRLSSRVSAAEAAYVRQLWVDQLTLYFSEMTDPWRLVDAAMKAGRTVSPARQSILEQTLDDVEPESVEWLWPGRIPLGKLTILDGDPDLGKSTIALDLAARVSTNGHMPDGTRGPVGDVLILSVEDGLEDTTVPRLIAVDARKLFTEQWHSAYPHPSPSGGRAISPAWIAPSGSKLGAENVIRLETLHLWKNFNRIADPQHVENLGRHFVAQRNAARCPVAPLPMTVDPDPTTKSTGPIRGSPGAMSLAEGTGFP